jgi:hypothetical protein
MKWVGILAAVLVIGSCFFPWVIIDSKNIIISGINASGTNYGKPGYFNMLLSAVYFALAFVPKIWSKRANLFFATLNFAWSFRNFILLAKCEGGECPDRQPALTVLLVASLIMLIALILTPLSSRQEAEPKESSAV